MSIDETRDLSSADQADDPIRLPERIGRYCVESVLGKGTFGQVYLATDDELDRRVAIKVSRRRFDNEQDAEAFLKEPRVVAQLDHPHIVPVYDTGRAADGGCYIVSKFIDGGNLKETIAKQRPAHVASAELVAHIADALHCAHLKGVFHRDIKPSNILLDSTGQPYVADFGLALSDRDWGSGTNHAGTPNYMSPEQLDGDGDLVNGRCDVFSLGVVLYELLTGKLPFKREREELLQRPAAHEVRPPRQLDHTIGQPLEDVCLRALSKKPDDRYSTAHDMAVALRRAVAPRGRRKWLAAAGAVLVFVLLLGGFMALSGWLTPERSAAGLPAALPPHSAAADSVIDVLVWNADAPTRRRMPLFADGAVPVRSGDRIRIEAQLNREAYAYVVWLDCQGRATPLFPWKPDDWTVLPTLQSPVNSVSLPANPTAGWRVTGPSGTETILLLERESPLPDDVDLSEVFADILHSANPLQATRDLIYFVDGRMLPKHQDRDRGIEIDEVPLDDPLLERQQQLYQKLRPHFEKVSAVSFAHQAE